HVPAPSGLDPEARRARLFRSLLELIQARARRELTLLWVEDLHWLDPASEVALEMLTERLLATESAGSRILLLATTRPEYRPVWSSRVEGLSLAPLGLQEFRTLVDDWLGADDMPTPLPPPHDAPAPGIPSRRRSPTAHSFSIAGAEPTPPSREPCSRSTELRPLRTPRSSPITSMRPANTWRRHVGTSRRADASHAVIRRMG